MTAADLHGSVKPGKLRCNDVQSKRLLPMSSIQSPAWLKRRIIDPVSAYVAKFVDDDVMTHAAAIAYSSTLAIAPLLILALAIVGSLHPGSQDAIVSSFSALVGGGGKDLVEQINNEAAAKPDWRQFAGWLSAAILVLSASAVFAQLQNAMNRIWQLENNLGSGLRHFLRRRLFSAGLLLALLFLTIIAQFVQTYVQLVPLPRSGAIISSWLLTTLVYVGLFSALYRWLPDSRVPWWTVLRGGFVTAILFQIGRWLIVVYLAKTEPGAAFGPASALVVWLLWSFYAALVFLASAARTWV